MSSDCDECVGPDCDYSVGSECDYSVGSDYDKCVGPDCDYSVGSDCDELWYVWCQISYPTYEPYLPSSRMEILHTDKILYLHTMLLWSQKLMWEIKIANGQWKI